MDNADSASGQLSAISARLSGSGSRSLPSLHLCRSESAKPANWPLCPPLIHPVGAGEEGGWDGRLNKPQSFIAEYVANGASTCLSSWRSAGRSA